jgi:uncharacterized protein YbjT (DUF2867 family)
VLRPVIRRVFAAAYADLAVMERTIMDSGLAWTIARPPRLTDDPHTGTYRVGHGQNVPGGLSVSRADLADALLAALADEQAVRATMGVAY